MNILKCHTLIKLALCHFTKKIEFIDNLTTFKKKITTIQKIINHAFLKNIICWIKSLKTDISTKEKKNI